MIRKVSVALACALAGAALFLAGVRYGATGGTPNVDQLSLSAQSDISDANSVYVFPLRDEEKITVDTRMRKAGVLIVSAGKHPPDPDDDKWWLLEMSPSGANQVLLSVKPQNRSPQDSLPASWR